MATRRRRLLGGLGLLAVALVIAGEAGVFGAERAMRTIESVHDDRVVPLSQFYRIVHEYQANVLEAATRVEGGDLSWEEGAERILGAPSTIDRIWHEYLATYLVTEEKILVRELQPRMSRVSIAILALEGPFARHDREAVHEALERKIRPELEAIQSRFSRLVDVQVEVAKREKESDVQRMGVVETVAYVAILVGICLAALIGVMAIRVLDDLRRSYLRLEETQTALIASEKDNAFGELAAVVAHEVRNPLGVIFNCVSSLRRGRETPEVLRILQEEAQRIERIVKNLLDFSRPQELRVQRESMGQLLAEARHQVEHRAEAAGVDLKVDVPPGAPVLFADPGLMSQALVNLLINAIEAAPRGGHVIVRGSIEKTAERTEARVDVSDDGYGISPEARMKIFQPFFTTKPTGTGLGLALVKRVIEAHGGEVLVDSKLGAGTCFTIVLPEREGGGPPVLTA